MPLPYYRLLGHCVVAAHALPEGSELPQALAKAGLPKTDITRVGELAEKAEELVEEKLDAVGEDRIHEHGVHAHVEELEMWMQTVRFRLRKAIDDDARIAQITGAHIHAEEHVATAAARALRAIASLRVDEEVTDALGTRQTVRDLLMRGQSLLAKVFKATEIRLAPEDDRDAEVFERLEAHRTAMTDWLLAVDAAARKVPAKDSRLLGRLGYVPEDVGIPVGGSSYAVVLHERGQTDPPDPSEAKPCTGWSVGRQGRNRENLGKGFLVPEFD